MNELSDQGKLIKGWLTENSLQVESLALPDVEEENLAPFGANLSEFEAVIRYPYELSDFEALRKLKAEVLIKKVDKNAIVLLFRPKEEMDISHSIVPHLYRVLERCMISSNGVDLTCAVNALAEVLNIIPHALAAAEKAEKDKQAIFFSEFDTCGKRHDNIIMQKLLHVFGHDAKKYCVDKGDDSIVGAVSAIVGKAQSHVATRITSDEDFWKKLNK
ncbi:hypothetical protein [Vibrio phage vB_pir03]|nr:hypothetical protein [Vibrio phage vB_pir03]